MTKLFPQERTPGTPSIANQTQFLRQFKAFTSGIFEGFDFSNVVVIGGSLVGSLIPTENENETKNFLTEIRQYGRNHLSPFKSADINLCIYGVSNSKFTKKLKQIYKHLAKIVGKERKVKIYQSSESVYFSALFPFRHVQVKKVYVSVMHKHFI